MEFTSASALRSFSRQRAINSVARATRSERVSMLFCSSLSDFNIFSISSIASL